MLQHRSHGDHRGIVAPRRDRETKRRRSATGAAPSTPDRSPDPTRRQPVGMQNDKRVGREPVGEFPDARSDVAGRAVVRHHVADAAVVENGTADVADADIADGPRSRVDARDRDGTAPGRRQGSMQPLASACSQASSTCSRNSSVAQCAARAASSHARSHRSSAAYDPGQPMRNSTRRHWCSLPGRVRWRRQAGRSPALRSARATNRATIGGSVIRARPDAHLVGLRV